MSTIWVKELTGGLDARRLPETTSGGVLIRGTDGHINRGGEFEKRAAFVPTYALPDGTVSLAAGAAGVGIYVFGSASTPAGIPSGVTYQRLQNGSATLLKVASYDLYSGLIYAAGEYSDGTRKHYYNGTLVSDWVDGRARATFQVTGKTGGTISVAVNGITIVSGAISWGTSNSATATAIAADINTYASAPNYTAVAFGEYVTVIAPTAQTADNGLSVVFTLASGATVDPAVGLTLQGGIDTTFPEPGSFVKTIGSKVYTTAGPYLVFSGIQTPTNWTSAQGAGFVDMSRSTSGSENLTALADYQNFTAILAERVIQVWTIASDPSTNLRQQILRNTGTASPRSVTQFGDADVFYLDESGLRSMRARDASNSAATTGIGVKVDPLIVAKLRSLSADERALVIGLIEPQDGRFWLIMKDVIYVFTYFPEEKVSAWTSYSPHYFDANGNRVDFNVDDAVVYNRRVYLRSGNTIFVYGGLETGTATDQTEAEAWPPYLYGDEPAVKKRWKSFDAAVLGQWAVSAAMSLRDTNEEEPVAVVTRTTYNEEKLAGIGESTHLSLRFRSQGTGERKLSAFAIHYDKDETDQA